MTAEREDLMLARAREIAEDDVPGLAEEVTGILGQARAARVDPDGLAGLTGAAIALGADQMAVYTAGSPQHKPHRDETEFMEAVAEAEDGVAEVIAQLTDLHDIAQDALAKAQAELRALQEAARRATERRASGGWAAEGSWGSVSYMPDADEEKADIAECERRIRMCEGALQIVNALLPHLRHALTRLRAVPDDLSDTYRAAYDLVRSGSPLPKDGDWFGEPDAEMAS